jgi:hypothetical protein
MPGFRQSLTERFFGNILNVMRIHFSRLGVKNLATSIQHKDVRDVALVVLLNQPLLLA